MSIVYNGAHSIEFRFSPYDDESSTSYNTWTDWHLVPASRPFIALPQPNYSLVALPGTSTIIDLTDFIPGGLTYGPVSGQWSFIIDYDRWNSWTEVYHIISSLLHGKRVYVRLVDDPTRVYSGRVTVDYSPGQDYSMINMNYTFSSQYENTTIPIDDPTDDPTPVTPSDPDIPSGNEEDILNVDEDYYTLVKSGSGTISTTNNDHEAISTFYIIPGSLYSYTNNSSSTVNLDIKATQYPTTHCRLIIRRMTWSGDYTTSSTNDPVSNSAGFGFEVLPGETKKIWIGCTKSDYVNNYNSELANRTIKYRIYKYNP